MKTEREEERHACISFLRHSLTESASECKQSGRLVDGKNRRRRGSRW